MQTLQGEDGGGHDPLRAGEVFDGLAYRADDVHFCVGAALARLEAQIVFRTLLERTTWIEATDVGEWLPSILVRRLERLELTAR